MHCLHLRLGVRKPMVQREHSKTCPEGVGSFFFPNWSSTIQVNKSSELRTDLKIVEPSYTTALHQLKSRITHQTCFLSIEYGGREFIRHRAPQNVLVDAPGYRRNRQQILDQPEIEKGMTHFQLQFRGARIISFEKRRPNRGVERAHRRRPLAFLAVEPERLPPLVQVRSVREFLIDPFRK